MNGYGNPISPKINTAEDFAVKHDYELHRNFKNSEVQGKYTVNSANGLTCKKVFETGRGMGVELLFLFLKNPTKIPPEFKGKKIFFTREKFCKKGKDFFILYLDCTGPEPDYGMCRIDHELPFNEKDFFVTYD